MIRLSHARDSSTVFPLFEKFISNSATDAVTTAAIVEIRMIWLYTSFMISEALSQIVAAITGCTLQAIRVQIFSIIPMAFFAWRGIFEYMIFHAKTSFIKEGKVKYITLPCAYSFLPRQLPAGQYIGKHFIFSYNGLLSCKQKHAYNRK